ncbi:MAG: lasso peptide biosynthesis B2 protein [Candidatus Acidiferrales bacterium]
MLSLVSQAYLELAHFELYLMRGNFAGLYARVRNYPTRQNPPRANAIDKICGAVGIACIWYWKTALCLQRSAATACLLRRNGVPAQLVIGVQQLPFKSHAWVEVDGQVVDDKPYIPQIYTVLDRC